MQPATLTCCEMLTTLADYPFETFLFEGREAIIVFPRNKETNGNWALKTEYWDAFPEVEIALLEKGFCVAFVTNESRLAPKSDCDCKARFAAYISQTYHLKNKCVPVGMSCGGAHAVRFAGFYPELVACMFIDAPVLNYCDFPGKLGAEYEEVWEKEFLKTYPGMMRYKLLGFAEHPICMTEKLIAQRVPTIMVWGDADDVVSYELNGRLLEQAMDGLPFFRAIQVAGRGHHPHGIPGGNDQIVDFILQFCAD